MEGRDWGVEGGAWREEDGACSVEDVAWRAIVLVVGGGLPRRC